MRFRPIADGRTDHARHFKSPANGRRRRTVRQAGEAKASELKGASSELYESMSEKHLEQFAETRRKGLPEKKKA